VWTRPKHFVTKIYMFGLIVVIVFLSLNKCVSLINAFIPLHSITRYIIDAYLEAFAVDDAGAGLVVLLLGDPHGLEGGQR